MSLVVFETQEKKRGGGEDEVASLGDLALSKKWCCCCQSLGMKVFAGIRAVFNF